MITTVIIAIVCFAVGGGLSYMLFRYGLKSKYDIIIKEAQTEAEVIKKNKLLEVKEKNDYVQLLPKLAFKYDFSPANNMYVSITRGYRSGGYNVQMFSELIQSDM